MMRKRTRKTRNTLALAGLACLFMFGLGAQAQDANPAASGVPSIARMNRHDRIGFSNGGWKYDRYKDLESLDAGKRITIADLQGPGIIRQIYIGKHHPFELMARGVVLEIYFEDAKEPAVMCPVADFFGDGCNGTTDFFAAEYFEHYPQCWSCYWPMPFRKRARVCLRNDTDKDTRDYSFVEWESVQKLPEDIAYFHATYARQSLRLTGESDIEFFAVKGAGHVVGRQFSIQSDDPSFKGARMVMEGNNEIDIDGVERVIDYLGTECSFNFGWGWPKRITGPRAGAPAVRKNVPLALSTYRLHHHCPIRFQKSLRWHINYNFEHMFKNGKNKEKLDQSLAADGAWVDFATVHYWYQDAPGGFQHKPLPPSPQRQQLVLGKEDKNDSK